MSANLGIANAYISQNEDVAELFGQVRHLRESGSILLTPKVILPILKEIAFGF
jgi:hypothetical protein